MAVGGEHRLAERLAREQIVAEIDRIELGVVRAMGREPALRRPVLAVLLLGAVLRDDEFRLQRDDLVMTGRHQRRSQHGVVILHLSLTPQTTRALRAMDVPRTMMFRAVERKSTRLNSSHQIISYAVFCLK